MCLVLPPQTSRPSSHSPAAGMPLPQRARPFSTLATPVSARATGVNMPADARRGAFSRWRHAGRTGKGQENGRWEAMGKIHRTRQAVDWRYTPKPVKNGGQQYVDQAEARNIYKENCHEMFP